MGYAISRSMDARIAVAALKAAIRNRQPQKGCIHHSDRGSQYASDVYRALLAAMAWRDQWVAGATPTIKAIIVCSPDALREQLDKINGKMTLLRRLAALRPGSLTSTLASAKASLRAIARRWLLLDAEIKQHDAHLEILTTARAPDLLEAHGMATGTAAEMLLLVGDNPERIHSEAAFAKLCGVCPIPASSGKTVRHRLNRGGNRQANAALYRVVIVRMRGHQPTLDYVHRRTAEGKSKSEIIRCLKRYVAREIFGYLCTKPAITHAAATSS